MRRSAWCFAAWVWLGAGVAAAWGLAEAKQPEPVANAGVGAAAYFSEGFLLVATVHKGDRRVEQFKKFMLDSGLLEQPWMQQALSTPQAMQAKVGLAGLAATAGTDPWTAVGSVLGEDMVIGLRPGDGPQPALLAVSVSRNRALVDKLLVNAQTLAGLMTNGKPDPAKTVEVRGETVFRVNEKLAFCRAGEALIVASDAGVIEQALATKAGAGPLLWSQDSFRKAERDVPQDAVAWVWADMPRLREAMAKGKEVPALLENPLGGFLFGGVYHALRTAGDGAAWLTERNNMIELSLGLSEAEPLPPTHAGFDWQGVRPAPAAQWAAASLPGYLGEIEVRRNWASLFSNREAILSLPAAGQVVNFSNTLTALLGQLDFMDQVLPAVTAPIRLIAVHQDFTKLPYLPTPRLPAFALITSMDLGAQPQLEKRLYSGSQSALSLVNLDAANKQQASYLIDTDRHAGYRMIFSEYALEAGGVAMDAVDKPAGEKVPPAPDAGADKPVVGQRYNFAPAVAVVEGQYIVATSTDLLRSVIDAIVEAGKDRAAIRNRHGPPSGDVIHIDGSALATLLEENRDEYLADQMLKKDISREQAEAELAALEGLLGLVDGAGADLQPSPVPGSYQARVWIRVKPASGAK